MLLVCFMNRSLLTSHCEGPSARKGVFSLDLPDSDALIFFLFTDLFNLIAVVFDNILQCARANPCYESDKCENRVPGYQCAACPDGFRGNAPSGVGLEDAQNSRQVCEEIDECKEGISSCDPNSQCINTNVSRYALVII